jgi:hypothetical protein
MLSVAAENAATAPVSPATARFDRLKKAPLHRENYDFGNI